MWFTIEIKLWKSDGSNNYTLGGAVVPIFTTSAMAMGLTAAAMIPIAAPGVAVAKAILSAIKPVGDIFIGFVPSCPVALSWFVACRHPPLLKNKFQSMRRDKSIEIIGGPHFEEVQIKFFDQSIGAINPGNPKQSQDEWHDAQQDIPLTSMSRNRRSSFLVEQTITCPTVGRISIRESRL